MVIGPTIYGYKGRRWQLSQRVTRMVLGPDFCFLRNCSWLCLFSGVGPDFCIRVAGILFFLNVLILYFLDFLLVPLLLGGRLWPMQTQGYYGTIFPSCFIIIFLTEMRGFFKGLLAHHHFLKKGKKCTYVLFNVLNTQTLREHSNDHQGKKDYDNITILVDVSTSKWILSL